MDKSEEFVKMCEEAKEIQGEWKIKTGDYCFDKEGKNWFLIQDATDIENLMLRRYDERTIDATKHERSMIWLPTQDQLQAMLKYRNALELCFAFHKWMFRLHHLFYSMEKMWLCFVMHEKYQKVWNAETETWEKGE